jgi:hypothetical protein
MTVLDGFSSYEVMNITVDKALGNELAFSIDILNLLWSYVFSLS